MPYVMVPVPEDMVQEVMQQIIRLQRNASLAEWTGESVAAFFDEIDEDGKAFLSTVARATTAGKDLAMADVASVIELNVRETAGIHRDLTELAAERNHMPLVNQRDVTEVLPNGRMQEKKAVTMDVEVAAMVRAAERDELLADGANG